MAPACAARRRFPANAPRSPLASPPAQRGPIPCDGTTTAATIALLRHRPVPLATAGLDADPCGTVVLLPTPASARPHSFLVSVVSPPLPSGLLCATPPALPLAIPPIPPTCVECRAGQ